ncbi:MAG: cytochrome c [Gemmatimonadetes bacterium]|nr:cytochrome c [Gemmatimonadota bacterium]
MRSDARRARRLHAGLAIVIAVTGCTRLENLAATVPFFAFMREAPFFDPYEAPRPAPANAVPFESPAGEVLPPIEASDAGLNAFAAGPFGQNPFAGEDLSVLGQQMYDRHCMVCHGAQGRGDGPIVQRDPAEAKYPPLAPDLTTPVTVARPDGYLYGMIRVARSGIMPPYGPRTTHRERWAIVTYVRQLQAAAGAQPGGN